MQGTVELATDVTARAATRSTARSDATGFAIFVSSALLVGIFLRFYDISHSAFPVGDGGLFYQMAGELQHHAFREPLYTGYNHGHIPFAYPPLGLYLAAFVSNMTGDSLLSLFRTLPFLLTCLAIVGFALLARVVLPISGAVGATFLFAVLPDSFDPEIKGGGMTRATGEVVALLAVWQLYVLFTRPTKRSFVFAVLFSALAVISHPEWGPFAVLTGGLFMLTFNRTRQGLATYAGVVAGTAVLSAPWWVTVIGRYGLSTLLAPVLGNASVYPMQISIRTVVTLDITHESWLSLGTCLVLVGIVTCLRTRSYLLPLWFLMVLVTDSRGWQIPLVVPLCLLAGVGLHTTLEALIGPISSDKAGAASRHAIPMWAAGAVVTFLLARSIGSTVVYETNSNPVVSAGERTAMTWIARHVSPSNQFLAIGTNTGSSEEDVEWFPALTGRSSVLTLQGTEWIPGLYARRSTEIQAVQACMPRLSCIERDLSRHHIPFSYVYLARASSQEPCESLCAALSHGSRYIRVYSGPGAWVFRRAGST